MDKIFANWRFRAILYSLVYVVVFTIIAGLGFNGAWAWSFLFLMMFHKMVLRYLL